MSRFAKATFSATGYAAARPTYPASLFRTVLGYHGANSSSGASSGSLLDIGCGHGAIARELSPHFSRVIGVDTSPGMVKQATSMTKDEKVIFLQGGAEDLSFLPDGSIDMVVAGQSAHWFDYNKAWPEVSRVVKAGGSLAFWGYKDNVLIGHTRANEIFAKYCYAEGEVEPGIEGMNAYWEQPGRNRVRNLLREVVPPAKDWRAIRRDLYDIKADCAKTPGPETAWMQKRMNLGQLEAYVRTFSAFQGWRDAHPEVGSRAEGGQGDLADILMCRIVESEPQWRGLGDGWRDAEVDTVWGTYVLMAKRR
ncbi:Crg1p S-adenosylmethionine-dependent methyltransferase [Metarhizium album ARSEF 1941]|uniref:Crg1p S-adenosylmethionine-dependent methyltransferase n=1 Tax=Metarhizium album (strain ARSEF 1941) TaxID=1081103 RepID=A0A0B2WVU6_METAS|nr:Crg1p S-adenosylmethionine-dependent methyltransferase [Metarhizium album ARSEF 1941]KHN97040.1 Crg1p S-adenosylmethionine-dependent methyltransferase [Metarhizium album ARSEF 1941]